VDKTLFNVHDLILLLTSFECLVFAFIILSNKALKNSTYYLFAALLISHSLIALHELVLWGGTFRQWVLSLSPNIFFSLNFSYLLDGPLVYLFISSLFSTKFVLRKQQLLHFIPVVIFHIYIYFAFWQLDTSEKITLINSYDIAYSWHYVLVDFIGKSIRIIYLVMAALLIKSCNADGAKRTPWVKYILFTFLAIALWEFLLTSIKVYGLKYSINLDALEIIGLTDYYAMFALLNLLIYIIVIESINKVGNKKVKVSEPVDMKLVTLIEKAMKVDKLYLNPNLSFERFSEQVNIPAKELSYTINRHYKINFYEYINNYRIIEAKENLENRENAAKTITDIFYNAGFNSKSVYNTLFKKLYKSTPSQYRKQALAKKGNK